jgi:hypothetical protein
LRGEILQKEASESRHRKGSEVCWSFAWVSENQSVIESWSNRLYLHANGVVVERMVYQLFETMLILSSILLFEQSWDLNPPDPFNLGHFSFHSCLDYS